jgi:hypothetical protein
LGAPAERVRWRLPLAVAGPVIVATAFALLPDAAGLRQRMFLAIVFGWLIATAFQVRSLRRAPRSGHRRD